MENTIWPPIYAQMFDYTQLSGRTVYWFSTLVVCEKTRAARVQPAFSNLRGCLDLNIWIWGFSSKPNAKLIQ
jgi:hypothetical protein